MMTLAPRFAIPWADEMHYLYEITAMILGGLLAVVAFLVTLLAIDKLCRRTWRC